MSNAGRKHNEFVRAHRLGPRVDSSFCQSAASTNAAPGVKRVRRRSASAQPVAPFCVLDRHRPIAEAGNSTTWRLRAFGFAWPSSNRGAEGPCEAAPHDERTQPNIVRGLAADRRSNHTQNYIFAAETFRAERTLDRFAASTTTPSLMLLLARLAQASRLPIAPAAASEAERHFLAGAARNLRPRVAPGLSTIALPSATTRWRPYRRRPATAAS